MMTDSNNTAAAPYSTRPAGHVHEGRCWERYYSCAMERIAWLEAQLASADSEERDG